MSIYETGHQHLWIMRRNGDLRSFDRKTIRDILVARTSRFFDQLKSHVVPVNTRIEFAQMPPELVAKHGERKGERIFQVINTSMARWQTEQVPVIRPATPAEWASLAVQRPEVPVNLALGRMVVQQRTAADRFYIYPWGRTERLPGEKPPSYYDPQTGRETGPVDYSQMLDRTRMALSGDRSVNMSFRSLLKGDDPDAPMELANIVAAMCVAEVRRRNTTHLINLMALDLIDRKGSGWDALLHGDMHPIARGGGTMEIENQDHHGEQQEIDMTMEWLHRSVNLTNVEFHPKDSPEAPANAEDRAIVERLFDMRMNSFQYPWEMEAGFESAVDRVDEGAED